jgi:hypothetical protein
VIPADIADDAEPAFVIIGDGAADAVLIEAAGTSQAESGGESLGRFDQPRTKDRKEARDVCGCESEDFEGNKRTMGKV